METTLIVKVIEGRFSHWYEIKVVDNRLISQREISDESEKIRSNIDKKYFVVNNPEVMSKLQFLCQESGSNNCINSVYMVGNEKKRTLSEVYSLGKPMDEPSLKRRAMADGNNKKKMRSVKKDGCWKNYEPVKGKVPYSKGSCRRKKKMFDGFDFKKIMRGDRY